jgi:glycosyltransferase involved in cell wall biosynthesis
MRTFDHIVFLSKRVDRARFFDHWLLRRFGGPDWSVIPNGTWPERFAKCQLDFRLQHSLADKFVILNVGVYAATKGQETSLRVFSESGIVGAALVFIGNELNGYSEHLKVLAARLPLGNDSSVLFLERLDREHIRAAYRAADLFMLTSKGETQPLVLLDAMACGLPFLATDLGCVSELPGGVTVTHPGALVETLRELRDDSARLATLGQLGLAAAHSTYHWPDVVAAYDRLIRTITRGKPRPNAQT